uniref:Thiosulfate/3-mercaptopyruvate sulfurtransferase 1, mitochondrial n=1 Tax=Lygus hesperus TaxID=30085 RepID=A0A0A9WDI6_LYGHE
MLTTQSTSKIVELYSKDLLLKLLDNPGDPDVVAEFRRVDDMIMNQGGCDEKPFVSVQWLKKKLQDPHVYKRMQIFDTSWKLAPSEHTVQEEYHMKHIPGALFFDLDRIAEPGSIKPHAFPTYSTFAE